MPAMVTPETVERLADKLCDLINSKPRSPWRHEIVAVLRSEFPNPTPDSDWYIIGHPLGPMRVIRT